MATNSKRSTASSRTSSGRGRGTGKGRSQRSSNGGGYADVMEKVRDNQFTAAAAAGAVGALAAGVFLWSRRDQISDQFGHLIEGLRSGGEDQPDLGMGESETAMGAVSTSTTATRGRTSRAGGMSETGGGGVTSPASGRGRARPSPVR